MTWLPMVIASWMIYSFPLSEPTQDKANLPSAETLVQRILDNQEGDTVSEERSYHKLALLKEFKKDGSLKRKTEREYRFSKAGDKWESTLLSINGVKATEKERKKEAAKSATMKRQFRSTKRSRNRGKNDIGAPLSREITDTFDWKIIGRTNILNRPAVQLAFTPSNSDSAKALREGLLGKVLGSIHGMVMMDEESAQIASVQIQLFKPFSFGWLGAIGSLSHLHIDLVRERLSSGSWVQKKSFTQLKGRRLFSSFSFENEEIYSEYQ